MLAGDEFEGDAPRRWLLVSRELPVGSEAEGSGRWSVDHLFVDQDAVPTLVEVKRSTDTRIRREVVGQMLDYAANAVAHWELERIRATFEASCEGKGRDPAEVLAGVLGSEGEPDSFWEHVKTNLQAGKIRLVFVADRIGRETSIVVGLSRAYANPAITAVRVTATSSETVKSIRADDGDAAPQQSASATMSAPSLPLSRPGRADRRPVDV